jgi:radical SAM superfamily enzyme YgiQ (UPF0313 family)
MQVAAVLEQDGYSAQIIDGILPDEIREGGENFFGVTMADMRRKIEASAFDIVGISAQFTFQWPNALETARLCKEINPDCTVVVGGAHASVCFEEILEKNDCVDIVVRGEGEPVFSKVVTAIRQKRSLEGVAGVAIRDNGGVASWPVELHGSLLRSHQAFQYPKGAPLSWMRARHHNDHESRLPVRLRLLLHSSAYGKEVAGPFSGVCSSPHRVRG